MTEPNEEIRANIAVEETGAGRFVVTINGHEAELTYRRLSPTLINAHHTGVPKALGGRGVGTLLIAALFEDAAKRGYKVIPSCPFIAAKAARKPEWAALLAS